jgi:hypothetical protein
MHMHIHHPLRRLQRGVLARSLSVRGRADQCRTDTPCSVILCALDNQVSLRIALGCRDMLSLRSASSWQPGPIYVCGSEVFFCGCRQHLMKI